MNPTSAGVKTDAEQQAQSQKIGLHGNINGIEMTMIEAAEVADEVIQFLIDVVQLALEFFDDFDERRYRFTLAPVLFHALSRQRGLKRIANN